MFSSVLDCRIDFTTEKPCFKVRLKVHRRIFTAEAQADIMCFRHRFMKGKKI